MNTYKLQIIKEILEKTNINFIAENFMCDQPREQAHMLIAPCSDFEFLYFYTFLDETFLTKVCQFFEIKQ